MYKKLTETVNLSIASGTASGSFRFTPQSGLIVACTIFTNGVVSPGFTTAKISNDSGEVISEAQDIRNYRDREAGYLEGKMPLFLEAKGQTFILDVMATANFPADFKCQLILIYQADYTKPQTC